MKAHDLSVGYSKAILIDLNFSVRKGEILGVLGPNGSGKSTLLKTLMRALSPLSGRVYINSSDIYSFKPSELAKKMSVMLTERSDAGFLTGFEVVALGRYPYVDAFGRLSQQDREIISECLRLVNAEHLGDRLFSEMSDGEKQKILIARALAQEPEVILMDEPTSFLDARHKIEIMLLLRRIASEKKVAIVLTTHDIELALRICDRVMLVRDGKVVAEGIPEETLSSDVLCSVYGVESASFEIELGSFEIRRNGGESRVHVVCGGGSGANIMRFLAKKNIPFTAGIVHTSDVDYVVARSTAADIVSEMAYTTISDQNFERAKKLVRGKIIIDTGFPVGEINQRNLELFDYAKSVLSFRSQEELEKLRIEAHQMQNFSELEEVLL